jgi:hypothetical protein
MYIREMATESTESTESKKCEVRSEKTSGSNEFTDTSGFGHDSRVMESVKFIHE